MPPPLAAARLYAIVDLGYLPAARLEHVTAALLAGGAEILQLRAKDHPPAAVEGFVRRILPLCQAADVPLIVNDHPAVAAATGAAGVHLGQDDGPLAAARGLLGPGALVGRSTHSPAQAAAALAEGADYIGFGPLFATRTKPGRPAIGLADIAAVEATVGTRIPVFCIGGIKPFLPAAAAPNLAEVVAAGARRVVIVSALLEAPDIAAATRATRHQLGEC